MTMEYFRRPQIAGNNLPYTNYAKLRGSIRRHDADGTSAVPYFDGVSGGQTIDITVKTSATTRYYTVSLLSNSITDVIESIHTATSLSGGVVFSTLATVIDDDGALTIQANTAGGAYYIEVTGGSAAVGLGFDIRTSRLIATGGDLETAPHGRLENKNGVSSVSRGENLTSASINRLAGRLAANADVLYADLDRDDAVLQLVTSVISTGGTYITPTSSARIFTGGATGGLSRTSSHYDLAPYFFLYDTATGQACSSRVVAVVKSGTVVASLSYEDCPNWAGTGNLLGLNLAKQSAIGISDILDGRTILLDTAADADIVVGDLVKIASCTNIVPLDNSKAGWVIEAISADSDGTARKVLTVRPMSNTELLGAGWAVSPEGQAATELNFSLPTTTTYGTVTVYTGPFSTNAVLMLDPPLPDNASVQLWAAQSLSVRDAHQYASTKRNLPESLTPHSDLDTLTNRILKAPTISGGVSSGPVSVTDYYVRWHGRVCYIPAATITPTGEGYILWDEHTCLTDFLLSSAIISDDVFNRSGSVSPVASAAAYAEIGVPLAYVNQGTSTRYIITRVEGEASPSLTVGWGGDFNHLSLYGAIHYLDQMALVNVESEGAVNGNYAHTGELVLVSDVTLDAVTVATLPKLKIRGASPNIVLTLNASSGANFTFGGATSFELENLTLKTVNSGVGLVSGASNLTMRNVTMATPSVQADYLKYVYSSTASNAKVVIENCKLNTSLGVVWSSGVKDIVFRDSTFQSANFSTEAQIISADPAGPSDTSTNLTSLVIDSCKFTSWPALQSGRYVIVSEGNSFLRGGIKGSWFTFAATVVNGARGLSISSTTCAVDDCYIGNNGVAGTSLDIAVGTQGTITNCNIWARPQNGAYGVSAKYLDNCTITGVDSVTGQTNDRLVQVASLGSMSGCKVSGVATFGVSVGEGGSVLGSTLSLAPGTYTTAVSSAVRIAGLAVRVVGNDIRATGGRAVYSQSAYDDCTVSDNSMSVTGVVSAIDMVSPNRSTVSNNTINNNSGNSSNGILLDSPTKVTVSNNVIELKNAGTYATGSSAIKLTGTGNVQVNGNTTYSASAFDQAIAVDVAATGNKFKAQNTTYIGNFTGNTFSGAVIFSGNNRVVGNLFDSTVSPAGVTLSQYSANRNSEIIGNTFLGTDGSGFAFSYEAGNGSTAVINDNVFGGKVQIAPWVNEINHITFNGNTGGIVDIALCVYWSTYEIVGNTISTLTLTAMNACDSRVVCSANNIETFTVAVGTSPNFHLTVGDCIFNYNVTIPDTGNPVTFSNNQVMGNASLATTYMSACTVAGTLSATSGRITASEVTGAATIPNCFVSDSYFGSTVGAVGDIHLANSTVVGAATVGQAGAGGLTPRNTTQTYISGTNFGSNLVLEGNISLSDIRCTGYLQTPSLGARPDDYRHEVKAANVVVEDSSANSLKLQSCDLIELSSVRTAGTATLNGYTTTKVSNFTGTVISATTNTGAEKYVVLDGIELSGNLTITAAGVVNISNLRCSGDATLNSTSSVSVALSRITNSLSITSALGRITGAELGQGLVFTGSLASANCLVTDTTCNNAELKMSGGLYGGSADISGLQSRDWLKVTSFGYVNVTNAYIANYADFSKDTHVKIDSTTVTDISLNSQNRQLGNVHVDKVHGRSIWILGGNFWDNSSVSITSCHLVGGTDVAGEQYIPILIQGPVGYSEESPRFVISNNVLKSLNVHTVELPVECLAIGRGSGDFVSPVISNNHMTVTSPTVSWVGEGTGHIVACMTVDAGFWQGSISNNVFRNQAPDTAALQHKAIKVYDNVPCLNSFTKVSGNLGVDTDGHVANGHSPFAPGTGFDWICHGVMDATSTAGTHYGVMTDFTNFHTPD